MITGSQIRMAIGALGWSLKDLSEKAGVSWGAVQKATASQGVPPSTAPTLAKMQRALEGAGIEFIAENGGGAGVRFRERSEGS